MPGTRRYRACVVGMAQRNCGKDLLDSSILRLCPSPVFSQLCFTLYFFLLFYFSRWCRLPASSSCTPPSFRLLRSKVRGKANRQIKANAVAACVALTRKCPHLWALLEEDQWTKPRGYSLLLQPFFLSPAINVGDVAVALQVFFSRAYLPTRLD